MNSKTKTYKVPLSEITFKLIDGSGNVLTLPCTEKVTLFRFTLEHPAIPEAPDFVKSVTFPVFNYEDSGEAMVSVEVWEVWENKL